MATRSELTQLLDSELQDIISSKYGVSDPTPHVTPARSQDDQQLPSLNYETQVTPLKHGMHGESYVDDIKYDSNGYAIEIIYAKDKTLYFDVTASVGNDNTKERDQLYQAVDDHFSVYDGKQRNFSDLHADVDEIRVGGTTDESRPDDAVRGDRLSIELDYTEYKSYTDFSSLQSMTTNTTVKEFTEDSTSDSTNFDYTNNTTSN